MEEVKPDNQFAEQVTTNPNDDKTEFTAELVSDGTVEVLRTIQQILMLQTALLMRLYDVNMRLLGSVDEDVAKELWDKHEKGGHENPATMIPVFETEEADEATS